MLGIHFADYLGIGFDTFSLVSNILLSVTAVLTVVSGIKYIIDGKKIFTFGGASSHDKEFRKEGKKEVPQVSTSSLPDIVYMLIFFFMITFKYKYNEFKY